MPTLLKQLMKNTSTLKSRVLVLICTALGTIPAAHAFAATVSQPYTMPSVGTQSQAANFPISTSLSSNWSGYVADSGSNYTSVTGTWVIPTVSSTQPISADAAWVGIGGMAAGSTDLIQAGTQEIIKNGTTTYQAWYETLPQASEIVPLTVQPGDTITASLSESSPSLWTIILTDQTTHQQYSTTVNYASTNSSAEWIEEMPSDLDQNFIPLDNFSQIPFTNASTIQNNSSENLVQAGARALTVVGSDNSTVYAYPSAIGSDGSSFTVTRANADSTVQPYQEDMGQMPLQWIFFPLSIWATPRWSRESFGHKRKYHDKNYTSGDGSYTVTVTTYGF